MMDAFSGSQDHVCRCRTLPSLTKKPLLTAELQSGVESCRSKRGYVDTVIAPEDTRKYVIGAFEMLFTKREDRPTKKHGTV